MSPEEAEARQAAYVAARFDWVHDPENGLAAWRKPVGRPPKRKPLPGVHDVEDAEAG